MYIIYIYINSSLIAEWNPLIKPIMNAWNTQMHTSLTLVWVKASMDHPLFPVSHPQICKILTYAQHPREVNLFTAVKHHNRTSQLLVIHWKGDDSPWTASPSSFRIFSRRLMVDSFSSSACLPQRRTVCPVWLAFQGSDKGTKSLALVTILKLNKW